MITVFTRGSFQFREPGNPTNKVVTRNLEFTQVPDWAEKTPLFIMLKKSGDLQVLQGENAERVEGFAGAKGFPLSPEMGGGGDGGGDNPDKDEDEEDDGANDGEDDDGEEDDGEDDEDDGEGAGGGEGFGDMTKKELKAFLDSHGVSYDKNANHAALVELAESVGE
jgi:hypothetical protein